MYIHSIVKFNRSQGNDDVYTFHRGKPQVNQPEPTEACSVLLELCLYSFLSE